MGNKHKMLKKGLAWSALVILILSLFIGFNNAPSVNALEVIVDTGLEESICEGLDGSDLVECESDSSTSFTNFEGEFVPPEAEGYAEGITQTSSAREFAVNVTNFILSFLGLAGVIVVIYGGFLYVTAGGEQERADKGKKSVSYAAIGIVIVLSSYALVNTLVGAAGEGGDSTSDQYYGTSGVSSESLRSFQADQMSESIKDITQDFLDEYTKYVNVVAVLDAMAGVDSFNDEGLDEMEEGFELVQEQVNSLSETADVAEEAIKLINRYVSFNFFDQMKSLASYDKWGQVNVLLALDDAYTTGDSADTSTTDTTSTSTTSSSSSGGDQDPYGIGSDVIAYMGEIYDAMIAEYQEEIIGMEDLLTTMRESFTELTTIDDYFELILNTYLVQYEQKSNYEDLTTYTFDSASGSFSLYQSPPGGSSQVGDIVELFDQLYTLIKDLEFTTAVITANTKQANAPATITFDGLQSSDPTNLTIPAANYLWDLNGDGFGTAADATGANVSYTYNDPGTYKVALKVISNDPDNVASGITYLSIQVNPPSSVIYLDATTNGITTDISQLTTWTVTGEQAKSGITFDATETKDGNGNTNTITTFKYSFGDGEKQEGADPVATHYYLAEGVYYFVLEVTDQNGITDRKIIALEVSSPAAHLEASKTEADIGEEITFDGSGSLTDNGQITYYDWTITKEGQTAYAKGGEGLDEIKYTFEEPGEYVVILVVRDSAGQEDDTFTTVSVESTPPVATFTSNIPDVSQPNIVHFDASKSYDPDSPEDTTILTHHWEVQGDEGKDYNFVEDTTETSQNPIIQFHEKGDWSVSVTVQDQYAEQDMETKTVSITSTLGIEVKTVGDTVTFLDDTVKAIVKLELTSANSTAYEIDWKDGSALDTFSGGSQERSYIYTKAGTYPVNVKVFGESNETNTVIHNVYIGSGETPIALFDVYADKVLMGSDGSTIKGNRTTSFKFDGSKSVDLDGTPIPPANFYWDFGDGTNDASGNDDPTHIYSEVGSFTTTLTVKSATNTTFVSTASVTIAIEALAPQIYGLTAQPQSDELITPLNVRLEAKAEDVDGEIVNYKFWYYDVENSSQKLETQISPSASTTMTINTNGTTGEVHEYGFAVQITDDENNTTNSENQLDDEEIPTLEVENGPNAPPIVSITVDRTNIFVGDSVNFSAVADDEDGEIEEYIWDFEGDGFFNNDSTTSASLTYTFDQGAPDGVEVRVKVLDDGGASATSAPIRIYVDSLTEDPQAAFTYEIKNLTLTFVNNSKADEENGASLIRYEWDFNADDDSDGNGVKEDDVDSTELNPSHTYTEYGSQRVKLIVYDNEGNHDEVINTVRLDETNPPEAAFIYAANGTTVTFQNNSKVDTSSGITIEGYSWDFDTDTDSDGNGTKDEDVDSDAANPSTTYKDYGIYRVKLVVTDNLGRTDDVINSIELEEPEEEALEAFLTSTPEASQSDGKIHLDSPSGSVRFDYNSTGGVGTITYCIDKNVYFDSDGNGKTQDDCNHKSTSAGSYTSDFQENWGLIVVQLTVTDEDDQSVKVMKEVVFDPVETAASLLPVTTQEALYILLTTLGFTIMGAALYTRKEKQN